MRGLVAIVIGFWLMITMAQPRHDLPPPSRGSPDYNWPTMGDHKRTVVTVHGRELIVGPCRFATLRRAGKIKYNTSNPETKLAERLDGDRWALKHCP